MRGARLGHPAHLHGGGRTHRVPPPRPGDHPHREHHQHHRQYQQHHHNHHHHRPGHPDRQRDQHAASTPARAPAAPAARPDAARGGRGRARGRRRAGAAGYVVQPGDTLSGIAAALGVRGGWPALYAANRRVIGPDPGLIRPGTTLALPGRAAPARYAIAAGDTLSGIAAALAVPGGWPALYTANRRVIGPDPNAIRAGTVLAIPHSGLPSPAPRPHAPRRRAGRASAPGANSGDRRQPSASAAPQRPPPSTARPASAPAQRRRPPGQRRPRSVPALPPAACPGGWRSCSSEPGCSSRPRS